MHDATLSCMTMLHWFAVTHGFGVPVQDMDTGPGEAGAIQLPPGEQVVTRHVVLPQNVLQMLQEHTAFLHQQGEVLTPFRHALYDMQCLGSSNRLKLVCGSESWQRFGLQGSLNAVCAVSIPVASLLVVHCKVASGNQRVAYLQKIWMSAV